MPRPRRVFLVWAEQRVHVAWNLHSSHSFSPPPPSPRSVYKSLDGVLSLSLSLSLGLSAVHEPRRRAPRARYCHGNKIYVYYRRCAIISQPLVSAPFPSDIPITSNLMPLLNLHNFLAKCRERRGISCVEKSPEFCTNYCWSSMWFHQLEDTKRILTLFPNIELDCS